jgi:uroporphyrinogen decarboxylase
MTAKERVMTSINHREPDRVPWDYWAASEVTERLLKYFGFKE